jgi:hypothetical protein
MTKITAEHLARSAYVYIRQSTPGQLVHNHESRRRQYTLADRARQLGWTSVEIVDDDLGRSGAGIARPGFDRLIGAVCAGNVGAVLAIEASHANHVSIGEAGDEYFEVSFDSEVPSDDDFDRSGPDHPYLVVQRQFEDDDGGVCHIETHDHDIYAGHFRLRLIEFTPTRLAFEIARTNHKYVEVTFDLDAKRFCEVQRIVHIIFGVQG